MQITRQADYAIRAVMYLAELGPDQKASTSQIAEEKDIPLSFLAKIIAQLSEPILVPQPSEREGYVPNVVYSCGAIIHNNELVMPYAMSDINSGIATVKVKELISCMHSV